MGPAWVLAIAGTCMACGPKPRKNSEPSRAMVLVATERGQRGGRLVVVGENGNRIRVLTQRRGASLRLSAEKLIIDRSPVFTRNGKGLIFTSNRERDQLGETSLWGLTLPDGEPVRLTEGAYVDRDPRISPDGKWLFFCSNRSGNFELYRAEFDTKSLNITSPEAITSGTQAILSPSISPNGLKVVYMAIQDGKSSIWRTSSDGTGTPEQITDGPFDVTPSFSPSGKIAYSSKVDGRPDVDLYLLSEDGGAPEHIVDGPDTDETGPRWSIDGRYLFSIGMYRSATDGQPLLGSVVYVDLKEEPRVLRVLHDRAAVESRIGLAIFPDFLNPAAMRNNPIYREALRDVILQHALRNENERLTPSL